MSTPPEYQSPDGNATGNLLSDGWEADYNHTIWKAPANGMYPIAGLNSNNTGGLPALKPPEKETTEENA